MPWVRNITDGDQGVVAKGIAVAGTVCEKILQTAKGGSLGGKS